MDVIADCSFSLMFAAPLDGRFVVLSLILMARQQCFLRRLNLIERELELVLRLIP